MTIKNRLSKINAVANDERTRQVHDSGNGRKSYQVYSTRTDAPYQVLVEWSKSVVLEVKAQLYTFNHKEKINQRGNHPVDFCKTTVCYQALGALKAAAKVAGKVLSVCLGKDGYKNAKRLLNLGGQLVKISNLGNGVVWAVVR